MYMEYKRSADYKTKSFAQYLASIGFTDPSVGMVGMDDEAQFVATPGGPQRLAIPSQAVVGEVKVKVLLVDFPDRPGALARTHYEDLLFSEGKYPTGSMRDFYKERPRQGRCDRDRPRLAADAAAVFVLHQRRIPERNGTAIRITRRGSPRTR